jgi:DNA-binding CsgD family transcriptional regulator
MSEPAHLEALVDRIYEAAVLPERWLGVLDSIAPLADAEGSILFAAGPPRWLASDKIRDRVQAWVDGPFFANNPRGQRLVPMQEPRFLTDLDAFTPEELDRDLFYTSFLRPNGLGWVVGTTIRSPAADTVVLTLEKAHAKGPVPREVANRLDCLRPHLARAAVLAARIGLEKARATVEGLGLVGVPAAILGRGARVLAANDALVSCAPEIRIAAGNRIEFANAGAQALFGRSIEIRPGTLDGAGCSIPVPLGMSQRPLVAHVLPMRGAGRDLFSGAEFLLYVTPVNLDPGQSPEILQALFDLTPAEARVSALLAEGLSVRAIAGRLSIQTNSVRAQLKSAFAKTGTSRQAELVSLLRAKRVTP